MLALFLASALAADVRYKVLVMPVTPWDATVDAYHALIPMDGAGSRSWASDTPGFECVGEGDFVEVWARRSNWPSVLPKAVVCTDGEDEAKAKIEIVDSMMRPMFAGNGALVLPRAKADSAIYSGPPPRGDLGVQQGKTGSLAVLCRILPGGVLEVTAYPTMEDGEGRCTMQTPMGEPVVFPVVVRTAKRAD